MRVIARTVFFAAAVFFLVGLLSGCQASPPPGGPTQITLGIPDREAFIDATLSLLRRRDFAPERVDRGAGVVVAQPSTGQQWFEFWRHDSLGGYQLLESSIHTVRRVVNVKMDPLEPEQPDNKFRVSVQVDKQRYSAPERQVTTASGALGIYSERLPTTEGLLASRAEGEHWIPLGRDAQLERCLLDVIARETPSVTVPSEQAEPFGESPR